MFCYKGTLYQKIKSNRAKNAYSAFNGKIKGTFCAVVDREALSPPTIKTSKLASYNPQSSAPQPVLHH